MAMRLIPEPGAVMCEALEPRLMLSSCGCGVSAMPEQVEAAPEPIVVAAQQTNKRNKRVRLRVSFANAVEGDAGQTTAMTFRVRRAGPLTLLGKGRVRYATAPAPVGNAAIAGADFLATSGVLRFKPGQRLATFTVTIVGNNVADGNRLFAVQLSNAKGATIQRGTGFGVIIDDDAPGADLQLLSQTLVSNNTNIITMQLTMRNNGGTATQPGQALFVATATGFPGISFPDDLDEQPGPVFRLLNQFNLPSVAPGQTVVQNFLFDTNPAIHCTDAAGRTNFGGYIELRVANDVNNANNTQTMISSALLPAPDTEFGQGCGAGWVTTPP
jgi:hypothetical protein